MLKGCCAVLQALLDMSLLEEVKMEVGEKIYK